MGLCVPAQVESCTRPPHFFHGYPLRASTPSWHLCGSRPVGPVMVLPGEGHSLVQGPLSLVVPEMWLPSSSTHAGVPPSDRPFPRRVKLHACGTTDGGCVRLQPE